LAMTQRKSLRSVSRPTSHPRMSNNNPGMRSHFRARAFCASGHSSITASLFVQRAWGLPHSRQKKARDRSAARRNRSSGASPTVERRALRSAPARRLCAPGPCFRGREPFLRRRRTGNPPCGRIKANARADFLRPVQSPSSTLKAAGLFMPADGYPKRPGPMLTRHGSGRRSCSACKHVCRHAPRGSGRDEYNPINGNVKRRLVVRRGKTF
jgi:hypothetical protein